METMWMEIFLESFQHFLIIFTAERMEEMLDLYTYPIVYVLKSIRNLRNNFYLFFVQKNRMLKVLNKPYSAWFLSRLKSKVVQENHTKESL